MQSKAATVSQYLKELPADRRAAIEAVRAVLLKNLDPLYEEGMIYGMIGYFIPHRVYPPGYHCNPSHPLPFAGLASQKNYLSLYLGCAYGQDREKPFRAAWAKTGKKLDMGKSCIRFKKVEDLALDVIAETISRMPARAFIEYYESVIKTTIRRSAGRKARTPAKPKAPKQSRTASTPPKKAAKGRRRTA